MTSTRLPAYFISHGGGPWPYMVGESRRQFDKLERSLIDMRAELGGRPQAVLMISGHWEEPGFAISSGARPGMEYDYYNFPDYLYRIRYAAPGSPELARRVQDLITGGGLPARLDEKRGFDHGTFSIMKPFAPDEDLPIVQLSLDVGMDPALHIAVGRLLAPLRSEGVLILGSGSSYHNMTIRDQRVIEVSRTFDVWLQDVLTGAEPEVRTQRLVRWAEDAPLARMAHPREDHLIPLMVVAGAAEQDRATCSYHQADLFHSLTVSSFRFGNLPAH